MRKSEMAVAMAALDQAQRASAVIRALRHSWVELPGNEVELLLEMSSGYADSVTEYLINLSGEEVNHA
ncbi:hypothetical protein [Yersinia pseudotuberculosis]|uniref:hypothetical protein n=1 Tax=Yersinia pseudotuberculosis TaxID=633 RepID=UPI000E0157D0|nr:hypothetical protein [Yersinia pseudotuberculosis]MBO1551534.1 hypothetical protein [Yersinia pseudotuberculosis]MBO1571584.1 hypothetical protein [Yersinia pseudotuberculosis]MBO1586532.1 hypothetical protein [Yersinia pseudotuberculosis]MBO1629761.1 hypothetical protein [Yersinia pseudotuberculosis]MBO1636035.1 hypothetical protein [Yersinia pseudotuberculosis]